MTRAGLTIVVLSLLGAGLPVAAQEPAARPLLEELQRLELDGEQTYKVSELYLRRDAVRIYLRHGTLVFLQPVAGRVTGAIFEGTGEVLVLPPDGLERQQVARFTGEPILTESFYAAYFRFSDETFADWQAQIRAGRGQPAYAPDVVGRWAPRVASRNRLHALRTLLDFLQTPPAPYFYAAISGERLGAFDVLVDDRRQEQILVGQGREADGRKFYDIWCSFSRRDTPAPEPTARTLVYRIEATITPAHELEATAEVDLELADPAQRVVLFDLSRFLRVEEVAERPRAPDSGGLADAPPHPLEFYQNEAVSQEEARYSTSDAVVVLLPPPAPGQENQRQRTLRFRYRGRVIIDIGSGVLYVGSRDNWYPRMEHFSLAHYDLRFRFPRTLDLVTVGRPESEREDGAWKESRWVTQTPLPVAGFNLGDYETRAVAREGLRVEIFANRQLEPQLARADNPRPPPLLPGRRFEPPPPAVPPAPPTLLMERVGADLADALAYFSRLFAPFPYGQLKVSQSPGATGQGYPGLIYLSTYSFLPDNDLIRLGLNARAREHYLALTPAHEVAHQWWGNWVRVPHYRDQWLAESLAAYSALLYLGHRRRDPGVVRTWMENYRNDLLQPGEENLPVEAAGALALGVRLNSSRSPNAYAAVIYGKGPWVVHMLRELLRDPKTGSDEAFFRALRALARRSAEEPLTTDAFEKQFEAELPRYADLEETGRLDWFFHQWVFATGVPRYQLSWRLRGAASAGWQVEGAVLQSGVPRDFLMPVPVFARTGKQLRRLGRVVVTGEQTSFRFRVAQPPDELLLDPQHTVLAVIGPAERLAEKPPR